MQQLREAENTQIYQYGAIFEEDPQQEVLKMFSKYYKSEKGFWKFQ